MSCMTSRRCTARAVMMLFIWSLPMVAPTGMRASHSPGDLGPVGGQGLAGARVSPAGVNLERVVRGGVERQAVRVAADRSGVGGFQGGGVVVAPGPGGGDVAGAAGPGGQDVQGEGDGVQDRDAGGPD